MRKCHLIGVCGTGMSALAQLLKHSGCEVTGSDRSYGTGAADELINKLINSGIKIFAQDGGAISSDIEKIIISRAIEDDNPELLKAKEYGIEVCYRQDVVKEIIRKRKSIVPHQLLSPHPKNGYEKVYCNNWCGTIAIAGTNGKTTVTGMVGSVFDGAEKNITILNGGIMKNYVSDNCVGNVRVGSDPIICVETDESEGDLTGYNPSIGVITNVGNDHLSMEELIKVYQDFAKEVKDFLVLNNDNKCNVEHKNIFTFGINNDADFKAVDIKLFDSYSTFKLKNKEVRVPVPGIHNVGNALAALSCAHLCGLKLDQAIDGLNNFKGIGQRYEVIGDNKGVTVISDYAHNPDKIRASLETAKISSERIIAVYQPHGFAPTKMFLDELSDSFSKGLRKNDILFISDIFYAGGTADKSISSEDLVKEIKRKNPVIIAKYIPQRKDIANEISSLSQPGDTILVMGARDHALKPWAESLV